VHDSAPSFPEAGEGNAKTNESECRGMEGGRKAGKSEEKVLLSCRKTTTNRRTHTHTHTHGYRKALSYDRFLDVLDMDKRTDRRTVEKKWHFIKDLTFKCADTVQSPLCTSVLLLNKTT